MSMLSAPSHSDKNILGCLLSQGTWSSSHLYYSVFSSDLWYLYCWRSSYHESPKDVNFRSSKSVTQRLLSERLMQCCEKCSTFSVVHFFFYPCVFHTAGWGSTKTSPSGSALNQLANRLDISQLACDSFRPKARIVLSANVLIVIPHL